MKTTIDIPDKVLKEALRFTKAKTKKEAIVRAVEDFNRRHKMASLNKYSGTFTSLMSNDEIEGLELKRMRKIFGPDFKFTGPKK